MTPETWTKLLAAVGGMTTVGAFLKWLYDRWTGRTDRRMTGIRTAIDAMSDAAVWADYAFRVRTWCRQEHGFDSGMPEPPKEEH